MKATRQRILDAAVALFSDKGYDGASLREVAEALGMTKAALYYHFRSKEDIFVELMETSLDAFEAAVASAQAHPDALQRKRALLEVWVDQLLAQREVMGLMFRSHARMHETPALLAVHERFHQLVESFGRGLVDDPGDPMSQSRAIFTVGGLMDIVMWQPEVDTALLREMMLEIGLPVIGERPARTKA